MIVMIYVTQQLITCFLLLMFLCVCVFLHSDGKTERKKKEAVLLKIMVAGSTFNTK